MAEEGSSVEVCFTLPSANVNENFALPSSVVFVPENSSNSGNKQPVIVTPVPHIHSADV